MKLFYLMFTLMIATILGCSESTTEEQSSDPGDASEWLVSFAEAKAKSSEVGKPILMEFTGSDWCPPCIALHDNVLTSDVFKQQIPEKFILLKLDRPRDKSKQTPEEIAQYKELSAEYNVKGVPTIIVADATGKVQHRQVGYNSRETPQEWVARLIAAGSP